MSQDVVAGGAALMALLGVWLCWRAPSQRIRIEERTKDGRISGEEGRRRIRLNAWLGPAVAASGCGLLLAALYWG